MTTPAQLSTCRLLILGGNEGYYSAKFELYCKQHNINMLSRPSIFAFTVSLAISLVHARIPTKDLLHLNEM
jgi:hypothetical protein